MFAGTKMFWVRPRLILAQPPLQPTWPLLATEENLMASILQG